MITLQGYNALRTQMMGDDIHAISKTIMAVTGEPYSHIQVRRIVKNEVVDDYDMTYTAEFGKGFIKKHVKYSHGYRWDGVIVPWTQTQEEDAVDIWENMLGMGYDTMGALGRATDFNIIKPNPKRTWCSKSFMQAAIVVDVPFREFMARYMYSVNIDPTPLMLMAMYYYRAKVAENAPNTGV